MITVPIEVSSRHVHISQDDLTALFGEGAALTVLRPISQKGQFAANETVMLIGPKSSIENARIVGPTRSETQVELSITDARRLGVAPWIRDSGNLKGSPGMTLRGPKGDVDLHEGVIVPRRHIHANEEDCKQYGLKPGMTVRVRIGGDRGVVLERVFVKVHPSFVWRLHLDTDEANAAGVKGGEEAEVLR